MLNHLYMILIASSVVCATLLAAVIFRLNHQGHKGDHFCSTLVGLSAGMLSLSAASHSFIATQLQHIALATLPDPFMLMLGPLLYWRLQRLLGKAHSSLVFLLQLLPGLLVLLLVLYLFNTAPLTHAQQHFSIGSEFFAFAHVWLYFWLCFSALRQYQHRLKEQHSAIDALKEEWLGRVIGALAFAYSAMGLIYLLNHTSLSFSVNQSLAIVMAGLTFYVVFQSLTQPGLLILVPEPLTPQGEKYQKSGLGKDGIDSLYDALQTLMQEQRPYLEAELNAEQLATLLGVSKQYLSEVINTASGLSFYDYVNGYRVEAVKHMLQNDNTRALLDIAMDCGFNSKASFNRNFKKVSGLTPGQYRQNIAETTEQS
ncbi:MAG: hypothetical protein COA42_18605 [Alteromonadaceae bacterium]|nr:MAG: hypothetical protein COA42_18605 [Alteromonadaceae bacterium]